MKINQFSQQGKRSNNEDSIGYSEGLLTVCDGMGGHVSGERASAFVVQGLLQAFEQCQPLGKMEIQQQLNKIQTDLNQLLENEPELEKMGTTFTGVFITPDVWYAAHIGDSRIYLFRPSEQKLWHTWDHSLVGELMRTKEITVEAGRFHPMSNRIAKAIIAQKDGKPASASIVKIDELKAGDIFMLCSDGVVEGWGDYELVRLFSDTSLSFDQKCKKLAQQCNAKSKDNNTALIAEIEEGDAFSYGSNDELEWTSFAEVEADYKQYLADNAEEAAPQKAAAPAAAPAAARASQNASYNEPKPSKQGKRSSKKPLIVILGAILLLAGLGVFFMMRGGGDGEKSKTRGDVAQQASDTNNSKGTNSKENTSQGNVQNVDQTDAQNAALQSETDEPENQMYNAIRKNGTIADCDAYLKQYPKGRFVEQVIQKKFTLEDKKAFDECKTIEDYEKYLNKYKDGNHRNEANLKISELKKQSKDNEEKEAYNKCTTIEGCEAYLKAYPEGQYVSVVKAKLKELQSNGVRIEKSDKPKEPAPETNVTPESDKTHIIIDTTKKP